MSITDEVMFEDDSGDRKYFTMVPNYILNHSTATAQSLYCQLKKIAGENGIAYPGSRYLMKKMGISQPTLRKEMKYLLERGWIKYIGDVDVNTDGGIQKMKSYKIVDIWKLNVNHYEEIIGCEKIDTPKGGKQGVKRRGEKIVTKEEPIKEDVYKEKPYNVNSKEFTPWDFKKYKEQMYLDSRKGIQIIAMFFDEKGLSFDSYEECQMAINEHLKISNTLAKLDKEKVFRAIDYSKREYPDIWKLTTVAKVISSRKI